MTTTARRHCPACNGPRPGLRGDPDTCLYCNGPLDPTPARAVVSTEPAPSLLDILEIPAPEVAS